MAIVSAVEHLVLFQVKNGANPAAVSAWLDGLRALGSLDVVAYLAAGPIHRCRGPVLFTHALHCRYRTAEDLAAYTVHPAHQSLLREVGSSLFDRLMAVDWLAELDQQALSLKPSSVVRATLARLKEGTGPAEKRETVAALRSAGDSSAGVEQMTCGENFSPARANGFGVASLCVFPSLEVLDQLEVERSSATTAMEAAESVIVVDFVVP